MDLHNNALKSLPPLEGSFALLTPKSAYPLRPPALILLFKLPGFFPTHLTTIDLFLLVQLLYFPLFMVYF